MFVFVILNLMTNEMWKPMRVLVGTLEGPHGKS